MSQISEITMSPRDFKGKTTEDVFGNIKLFIPHVFPNYSGRDIAFVFERLRIGKVRKVDVVSKWDREGKKYFAAYIQFDHWFDNTAARNFQARVLNPYQEARIVYDDPWYWIVLPYKNNKNMKNKVRPVNRTNLAKIHPEPSRRIGKKQPATVQYERELWEKALEEIGDKNNDNLTQIENYIEYLERENDAWRLWGASFQLYMNQ